MNNVTNLHEDGATPSRRTIVAGAAWTIPVIAVATAAPFAVASPALCPPMGGESNWTATWSGPYDANSRGVFWNGNSVGMDIDHQSTGTTDAPALVTLTRQFDLVAGQTYSFNYEVAGETYDTSRSWRSDIEASIGDAQIVDNRETMPYDASQGTQPLTYVPRTLTFTPSATGPQTFTFTMWIWPRNGFEWNDNIFIRFPDLPC